MTETAFEDLTPPSLDAQPDVEQSEPTPKPAKVKKAKKVKEVKADEAPVVAAPKRSKLSNLYPEDAVIRVVVDGNPKKSGSRAHTIFGFYQDGMTIGDFFAATADVEITNKDGVSRKFGGDYGDITYDVGHGYIKIEV